MVEADDFAENFPLDLLNLKFLIKLDHIDEEKSDEKGHSLKITAFIIVKFY